MQSPTPVSTRTPDRVPNRDRSDRMRQRLIEAGRRLFLDKGFAATGTPDIVAEAGVTRGALYHHFDGKEGLFEAVIRAEAQAVAQAIREAEPPPDPVEALVLGARDFLVAMAVPGRAHLLLVAAPAVLGPERMATLDAETGGATLVEGLRAAGAAEPVAPMAALLSAAHDRAALEIANGADPADWAKALDRLLRAALS